MIFALFHVSGLLFLFLYYKIRFSFVRVMLIGMLFLVYYITALDQSYLAMLLYAWVIYFINTYLVVKDVHTSYHVSMTVIVTGLIVNSVVVGDGFYFYEYMLRLTWVNLLIVFLHISLMLGVLGIRRYVSFQGDVLYVSRFTYINLAMHFMILTIHLIRDIDLSFFYIVQSDLYYYQAILMIIFFFYLLLILSAVFYDNKRGEEKRLLLELSSKQKDLHYLFDTEPTRRLSYLKKLVENKEYAALLGETKEYMQYHKKVVHKRVLGRLNDDLLAYVTMETISKEQDVAFEIVVEHCPQKRFSKQRYFLEMYGIVLDNAVKAARKAEFRFVKVVFYDSRVVIENSFHQDDVQCLMSKESERGPKNRINGLKLLSYLEGESTISVQTSVTYRVVVSLEVDHA